MTLTINLTGTAAKGVNFNADFKSFFADLTPTGWPYILGGASMFEGDQIVLLDQIEPGRESQTKTIVIDGSNINYYFNDHTLSGTMQTVRLSTLGASYNPADGSFARDASGHIANISTSIEIAGLSIYNPYRERGDFHDTAYGLMGGGHNCGASNPTKLEAFLWAEAHRVNGSAGNDIYSGTRFADVIFGNNGADRLSGQAGADTINGGAGDDRLDGGLGADVLNGGLGNDIFFVDSASDRLIERLNEGVDQANSSVNYVLGANVERLVLTGSAINGTGNAQANVIFGNAFANVLNGGGGADTLIGGLGNDTYLVDNTGDRVSEGVGQGVDRVISSATHVLGANVENLTLNGSTAVNGTGNTGANAITGNIGANILNGGAGNDLLNGSAGNDKLIGGAGADRLIGGAGADAFLFNSILDSTVGVPGRDLIQDFAGNLGDRIDLTRIDANATVAGNQAFSFVGTNAFSGAAGELRYQQIASQTYVFGDVNGDGQADFAIHFDDALSLSRGFFIL